MSNRTRRIGSQVYTRLGTDLYTRRDGSKTTLVVRGSCCADCGQRFTVKVPSAARRFEPNRRCQLHKRPGVRVGPRQNGRPA